MGLRKILRLFLVFVSTTAIATLIATISMKSMMPHDYLSRKRPPPLRTLPLNNLTTEELFHSSDTQWAAVSEEGSIADKNEDSSFASNIDSPSGANRRLPSHSKEDSANRSSNADSFVASNTHLSAASRKVLSALAMERLLPTPKKDPSLASEGYLSSVSRKYSAASRPGRPMASALKINYVKSLILSLAASEERLPSALLGTSSAESKIHSFTGPEDRTSSDGGSSSRGSGSGRQRILCWIPSTETWIPTRIRAVNETWVPRCDGHVFFVDMKGNGKRGETTNRTYDDIVSLGVKDGRVHLSEKSVAALTYLYVHSLDDYEWFVKADDDTFLVLENLRLLLRQYDPSHPVYLGRLFKPFVRQGYMSGGASYVLSRVALKKLVEDGFLTDACWTSVSEDVAIGQCLQKVGILPHNTRDKLGREAFHPENMIRHMGQEEAPVWLRDWDRFKPKGGPDCCSELSISFHHMLPPQIYSLEQLLYRTTVYGRTLDWTKLQGMFKPEVVTPPSEAERLADEQRAEKRARESRKKRRKIHSYW